MIEFLAGAFLILCGLGVMAFCDELWRNHQDKKAQALSLPETWRKLAEAKPRAAGPKTSERRVG